GRRREAGSADHQFSCSLKPATICVPSSRLPPPASALPPPASLSSLPLDGRRRFRADVVNDPIDPLDLIDDPARYPCEDIVRKGIPVCSHAVCTCHRAKSEHIVVGSLVAHHSDA